MSWPAKTRDFNARGCEGREADDDGVVIWLLGVKAGTEAVSGIALGGGAEKEAMEDKGVVPAEKAALV